MDVQGLPGPFSSSASGLDRGDPADVDMDVDMDPEVWGRHLPEEVIHTILAWLPLHSYCRLRSVCKKWNESAFNPCFRKICGRIPRPAPFWVVFACGGPLVYDTSHSTWHVASSFLSYDCFTREAILDAAGSLLFYRNFDPHDRLMFVFNPMSKHKRRLPAMLTMDHCYLMGIVLDREMASYKVYAVDQSFRASAQSPEVLKLQLFDSIRGRWEMSGSLLRDPEDPQNERHEVLSSACCNGRLYFLTERLHEEYEDDQGEPQKRKYKVFRVGPETWEEVPALMPTDLSFPRLFENRGRLLLAGGVAGWIGLLSVSVWQLVEEPLEWMEILRMPEELVRQVAAGFPIVMVANGDFIGVGSGRQRKLVRYMCDMNRGSWWALPSEYQHVALNHLEGLTSSGTLLFEPRLDVIF